MEDLKDAADRFALGEVYKEDLPMIAAHALARGIDSPALRELAGRHRNDCSDAPDLFLTVLSELGLLGSIERDWPTRQAAVLLRRARELAAQILTGEANRADSSGQIAWLLHQLAQTPEPYDPGLGDLASDFEIDQAARHLLAGPPYEPVWSREPTQPQASRSRTLVRRWLRNR